MVLAAIEQYEPPDRRLVDDDLRCAFLPAGLRALVRATRWPLLRRLMIGGRRAGGARAVGQSSPAASATSTTSSTRRLPSIDAVVDSRCRAGHQGVSPGASIRHPGLRGRPAGQHRTQEGRRAARVFGAAPASVHLVPLDFERDDLIGRAGRARIPSRRPHVLHLGRRDAVPDRGRGACHARRAAVARLRAAGWCSPTSGRTSSTGGTCTAPRVAVQAFPAAQQVWQFGLDPDEVSSIRRRVRLAADRAGGTGLLPAHTTSGPTGRNLTASQLEWSAYAEKT